MILAILSFVSVLCTTASPFLAANSLTLSLYYTRDFTQIALLTGYHLLGVGVAGFMFVASARVWGKRHLFLLGNILMVVSSIWGGASGHNYKSLLWARVFQGIALAPFEALVNACVGDLYFVHVRFDPPPGAMV
jgi:MFS family permease